MTPEEWKERILRLLEKVPPKKMERLYWYTEGFVVGRW